MKLPSSTTSRGGQLVFAIVFVMFATFLISMLGSETRFTPGKQLFAQPRFWPGVAVVGMLVFGIGHLACNFRLSNNDTGAELFSWIRSLEYLFWFMAYVFAVPKIGYLPTTLIFMLVLVFRLGYRSTKVLTLALIVALSVVLVFKAGLAVKIPGGALYEYLPDALRYFMISNF